MFGHNNTPIIPIKPTDEPVDPSLPYKCDRKTGKKPVCIKTHKGDKSEGVFLNKHKCEEVCKPQAVLPGQVNLCPDQPQDNNKMSCCEIVAIVAGSLVLLLLLVSLVSKVSGGAKKSRRTARRTARRTGRK